MLARGGPIRTAKPPERSEEKARLLRTNRTTDMRIFSPVLVGFWSAMI